MMAQQFFITGTDTGVGKTVLSALLCAAMGAFYWKPIQTGAEEDSDSLTAASLAELPPARMLHETYRFAPPVSPHLAAKMAGVNIELEKIRIPYVAQGMPLIVEGAGGVLVPLNEYDFMADLMRQLGLPVLLASRSTLGTINHTLLSLAALRQAGVAVRGVVMIGPRNADNREAIEKYGETRVVGEIPLLTEMNRASLLDVFAAHFEQDVFGQIARAATNS